MNRLDQVIAPKKKKNPKPVKMTSVGENFFSVVSLA
jgi:hypothetical protein